MTGTAHGCYKRCVLIDLLFISENHYIAFRRLSSRTEFHTFVLHAAQKLAVVNLSTHVECNLANITDYLHNTENVCCCILPFS